MSVKWIKLIGLNYEVSDEGNVRNYKTKRVLKKSLDSRGYHRVSLSLGKRGTPKIAFIHRLVAENFILNPLNKEQVNHINGDKLDNRLANLEWTTPKENVHHAMRTGLFNSKATSKKATKASLLVNSKPVISYNKKSGEETTYNSISECSRVTGISISTLRRTIKNSKEIKGVTFKCEA